MGDLISVVGKHPRIHVPSEWDPDGYKTSIDKVIRDNGGPNRFPHIVLIGHSFSAIPILEWIRQRPGQAHYFALIDPVSEQPGVDTWEMPTPHPSFDWFRRNPVGFTWWKLYEHPLNILNAGVPREVPDDPNLHGRDLHNELPHQPSLIAYITLRILQCCSASPALDYVKASQEIQSLINQNLGAGRVASMTPV